MAAPGPWLTNSRPEVSTDFIQRIPEMITKLRADDLLELLEGEDRLPGFTEIEEQLAGELDRDARAAVDSGGDATTPLISRWFKLRDGVEARRKRRAAFTNTAHGATGLGSLPTHGTGQGPQRTTLVFRITRNVAVEPIPEASASIGKCNTQRILTSGQPDHNLSLSEAKILAISFDLENKALSDLHPPPRSQLQGKDKVVAGDGLDGESQADIPSHRA